MGQVILVMEKKSARGGWEGTKKIITEQTTREPFVSPPVSPRHPNNLGVCFFSFSLCF
jgi:hypothetical protein